MEEFNFLETLLTQIEPRFRKLPDGPGDDCAVMSVASSILLSQDVLVEGVHFNLSWSNPRDVAWKCLATNESDIASMGGIPRGYTLGLVLPPGYESFAREYYTGLNEYFLNAESVGYPQKLLGGDLSSGTSLSVSISVVGEVNNKPVLRSGAVVGEILVVSGELGLAGIGLHILKDRIEYGFSSEVSANAIMKHKRPQPRTALGKYLSDNCYATSMIDISDGLFQDASHIAKSSRVSFLLALDEMQYPNYLNAGDDYELLFTLKNMDSFFKLKRVFPNIKKIGQVLPRDEHAVYILDGGSRLDSDTYLKKIGNTFTKGYQHSF